MLAFILIPPRDLPGYFTEISLKQISIELQRLCHNFKIVLGLRVSGQPHRAQSCSLRCLLCFHEARNEVHQPSCSSQKLSASPNFYSFKVPQNEDLFLYLENLLNSCISYNSFCVCACIGGEKWCRLPIFISFSLSLFHHAHSMQKFLGQGFNPHHRAVTQATAVTMLDP